MILNVEVERLVVVVHLVGQIVKELNRIKVFQKILDLVYVPYQVQHL